MTDLSFHRLINLARVVYQYTNNIRTKLRSGFVMSDYQHASSPKKYFWKTVTLFIGLLININDYAKFDLNIAYSSRVYSIQFMS